MTAVELDLLNTDNAAIVAQMRHFLNRVWFCHACQHWQTLQELASVGMCKCGGIAIECPF